MRAEQPKLRRGTETRGRLHRLLRLRAPAGDDVVDGVGDEQVPVGVQRVPQIVEWADLRGEVARIGVEYLQPVADPASGLLGPRREFAAQGQDGGRVAGAPLDLAAEGLAEVDAEPDVGAEPCRQADQVRAGGDLPARVVVVHRVVAQHGCRQRLRRPRARGAARRWSAASGRWPARGRRPIRTRRAAAARPRAVSRRRRRVPTAVIHGSIRWLDVSSTAATAGASDPPSSSASSKPAQLAYGLSDVEELTDDREYPGIGRVLLVELRLRVVGQLVDPAAVAGVGGELLGGGVRREQVGRLPGGPVVGVEPRDLGLRQQQASGAGAGRGTGARSATSWPP